MQVTHAMIEEGLRTLGVCAGDAMEVHASLRSFGWIDGGAATLVDTLMQVVSSQGTLLMSDYCISAPMPLTPDDQARGIIWKVRVLTDRVQAQSGMGSVVDEFTRRPGVLCGCGILRICAWGRDAHFYRHGYQTLIARYGKTLLLGVGVENCSSLHLAEDISLPAAISAYFQVPDDVRRDYPPGQWIISCGETPDDAWEKIWQDALERGFIRQCTIGHALCSLFETRTLVELLRHRRRTDPFTLYGVPKS